MKKIIEKIIDGLGIRSILKKCSAFSNIAEGTHAGNITMFAAEDIDTSNLLVKVGANPNEIKIAGATDKPFGICNDQGAKDEPVNVVLPASAESTFLCVCSSGANFGDALFTASNGKVSTVAADGSYKVGIAVCDCASNGIVEIDPQGFGERSWQIAASGVFDWSGSLASSTMTNAYVKAEDVVFASIVAKGGQEKSVNAVAANGSVVFTLDVAGTAESTKIAWIIIRKN